MRPQAGDVEVADGQCPADRLVVDKGEGVGDQQDEERGEDEGGDGGAGGREDPQAVSRRLKPGAEDERQEVAAGAEPDTQQQGNALLIRLVTLLRGKTCTTPAIART